MAYSNKLGGILLATGNRSEVAAGYATLYGDMCGGLAVISDLYKTEVYAVSRFLNRGDPPPIPQASIDKAPSAELLPGQLEIGQVGRGQGPSPIGALEHRQDFAAELGDALRIVCQAVSSPEGSTVLGGAQLVS
mgnify:CR=1 FL=1